MARKLLGQALVSAVLTVAVHATGTYGLLAGAQQAPLATGWQPAAGATAQP